MASAQQAQDLSQFKEKKKAIVNELVKQAKASAEKNSNAAEEQVATVAGVMRNSSGSLLKLQSTPTGSGHFLIKPPDTLIGEGAFVHQAPVIKFPSEGGVGPVISQLGSKAAVVYGTTDKALPHLGYLLAWYKARDSSEHKVYVQAGDLSELKNMKWADIEKKLDASKDESYFCDEKTRAFAFAKIKYDAGNVALLGADFGIFLTPPPQ